MLLKQAVLPTHLDTALSRMSWILESHALLKLQLVIQQNIVERQLYQQQQFWYENKVLCV